MPPGCMIPVVDCNMRCGRRPACRRARPSRHATRGRDGREAAGGGASRKERRPLWTRRIARVKHLAAEPKIAISGPDAGTTAAAAFRGHWPGGPGGSAISMSPGGGAAGLAARGLCAGSNFGVSVPVRASRSAVSMDLVVPPAGRSSSSVTPHSSPSFLPSTTTSPGALGPAGLELDRRDAVGFVGRPSTDGLNSSGAPRASATRTLPRTSSTASTTSGWLRQPAAAQPGQARAHTRQRRSIARRMVVPPGGWSARQVSPWHRAPGTRRSSRRWSSAGRRPASWRLPFSREAAVARPPRRPPFLPRRGVRAAGRLPRRPRTSEDFRRREFARGGGLRSGGGLGAGGRLRCRGRLGGCPLAAGGGEDVGRRWLLRRRPAWPLPSQRGLGRGLRRLLLRLGRLRHRLGHDLAGTRDRCRTSRCC